MYPISSKGNLNALEPSSKSFDTAYSYLYDLLEDLEGVMQSPKYHPERDALYHSLQVFECSLEETQAPTLWAASLFHDVGKSIDYPNHDKAGAQELAGVLNKEICWLIEHHLDLLTSPAKTRRRWRGTTRLSSLEKLRRWDLQGRKTDVKVMDIHDALTILAPYSDLILE